MSTYNFAIQAIASTYTLTMYTEHGESVPRPNVVAADSGNLQKPLANGRSALAQSSSDFYQLAVESEILIPKLGEQCVRTGARFKRGKPFCC